AGSYGHGGAFGTQGWLDPHKNVFVVLLIQRTRLANSDASPMRRELPAVGAGAGGQGGGQAFRGAGTDSVPVEVTIVELTQEQKRELKAADVPRVVDPETHQKYVLIREEVYERIKGLLGDEISPWDTYPAIDRVFADGWDDPRM